MGKPVLKLKTQVIRNSFADHQGFCVYGNRKESGSNRIKRMI